MANKDNLDKRITNLLKEGPMVAAYIVLAVEVLDQVLDQQSDEDVYNIMMKLEHPTKIRKAVKRIKSSLTTE